MPLNLSTPGEGGDFTPSIKFNAKDGAWFKREDGEDVEVSEFQAVFDLENIQTGWLRMMSQEAPDFVSDPSLSEQASRPSDEHKRAFKVNIYSDKQLGGVREWMANSMMATGAMARLYAEYEEKKEDGKAPVVVCGETNKVKLNKGTNYEPVLKLSKMVKRPDAFDSVGAVEEDDDAEF
tara:strand:- start:129 stop:665 length:537 start_codon:yes stop_codon:yes gene_type:complete